jgi:hypothetical protein
MTPAENILEKLDLTAFALAHILGLNESTVYKWTYSIARNGTGGTIPYKYHSSIMKIAKKRKVELGAEDFVVM